jgi:prepilin-type N-terminal cleavage/methylation domain-containing protein
MQFKQSQFGVTMIELLFVVTIAGILAMVAAPSFAEFINNTRQNSAFSQLTSDLNRARNEAIKRNSWVVICARDSTGTDCSTTGTNWQNGWLVCYDKDKDGSCDTDALASNPNPIVIRQALNANLTLIGSAILVRFNPNGTQGTGGAATLTLGGSWAGAQSKVANIAATGNIFRP